MKSKPSFSLKEQLFNKDKVNYLANLIKAAYPEFEQKAFSEDVLKEFPKLELKERINNIAENLAKYLPNSYPNALAIILQSLPPELDKSKTDNDFGDFIFAPLSLFVAKYGCEEQYLDISLNALKEITKRFSAEYAIRFFINKYPERSLEFLEGCCNSKNYHVRRLASEGSRPKLPWAQKLLIDYHQPLTILDKLFSDNTRYVSRSVANHLNDLAKLEPKLVIDTLKRWRQSNKQTTKEMEFISKHALRTLIKQGNPEALELIGFSPNPQIEISQLASTSSIVKVGESFEFSFVLKSLKKQKLMLDYIIEFANPKKNKSKKVFKIKQLELAKKQEITIFKKHPIRLMTTRRLYTGKHSMTLQINGQQFGSLDFDLIA